MLCTNAFLSLALATALTASASFASTDGATTQKTQESIVLPSPVKIVSFTDLPKRFEDATVHVTMTIDETGTPRDIQIANHLPRELTSRLIPALEQWRFRPAQDKDGRPISLRVELPLELVAAS